MKLTSAQVDMSFVADTDYADDEFDTELFRTKMSRKEIRSKGDRERGEVILHDGKTCKQVRKY